MANTPVYGWETPDDTDYVYQGAAAARTTANAIDSTLSSNITTINNTFSTSGYGVKTYAISTATLLTTSTNEAGLFGAAAFTPVAGRLYEITYTVGNLAKRTNAGTISVLLRNGNTNVSTLIDWGYSENVPVNASYPFSKTIVLTSTQLGTSPVTLWVRIQPSTNGSLADNSGTGGYGSIIVKDIGPA